jgi:hypothetical protein
MKACRPSLPNSTPEIKSKTTYKLPCQMPYIRKNNISKHDYKRATLLDKMREAIHPKPNKNI